MQHKIREQVMDLTISGRLDAFRAQHLAGPFYYRQLLPALEKIFDELSTSDEVISVDKLELDLGIIPLQELEAITWNNEWETLLRGLIQTALQEQRKNANPQRSQVNTNSCRQWLFYLERGHLDWNASRFDEKTMQSVLEVLATDYVMVEKLRQLIIKSKNASLRILNDNAENFLISLVETLTASAQQTLSMVIDELITVMKLVKERSGEAIATSKQLRREVWLQIIELAATDGNNLSAEKLAETVLLSKEDIPSAILYMDELVKAKTIQPALKKILETRNKTKHGLADEAASTKSNTAKTPESISAQSDDIDEDGIFVSHAGLVLLHPFLSTFFKRLELVADGKFRDMAATEKAIHLLHYLATGNTGPQEHELAIPKLLCALPIHTALKESIELKPADKQEADDLLLVVIEKWEKLKNISIDALRENFLVRTGKLYTKNDKRYLQVEGSSLDVLLDYLPWTLSVMKLPWMKDMIRIEWR
jgi:hypothetical protein